MLWSTQKSMWYSHNITYSLSVYRPEFKNSTYIQTYVAASMNIIITTKMFYKSRIHIQNAIQCVIATLAMFLYTLHTFKIVRVRLKPFISGVRPIIFTVKCLKTLISRARKWNIVYYTSDKLSSALFSFTYIENMFEIDTNALNRFGRTAANNVFLYISRYKMLNIWTTLAIFL